MSPEEIQCREQLKTLKTNLINVCLELMNLLRLSKRIGYYCPVEYISEPFYILYACHKEKVLGVKAELLGILEDRSSQVQILDSSIEDNKIGKGHVSDQKNHEDKLNVPLDQATNLKS